MKSTIVCCLLLTTTVGLLASENAKPCTTQDAIRAEKEASSLRSWAEVYKSYKHVHCDDGAIGEGYSDSIARLLSRQWSSVDQLNRLASQDRGFERFVLRHVDELLSSAQVEKIRANAGAHCPIRAEELCKLIAGTFSISAPGTFGNAGGRRWKRPATLISTPR